MRRRTERRLVALREQWKVNPNDPKDGFVSIDISCTSGIAGPLFAIMGTTLNRRRSHVLGLGPSIKYALGRAEEWRWPEETPE